MSRKDLSRDQRDQLAKLVDLPDSEIDTSDIPEAPAENWIHARRGNLYRPVKQPVTIRLDADVLSWIKEHVGGGGYQTEINRVLRRHVIEQEKRRS
ncbi:MULTISPECIES: BrnA antitoxin family protein [unclassified Mesorhizobium]|uniref:BrnA antitoxin family protein n=1 Tax=unclassified Mesorhizobium TaxID=325217 RepID=UPI001CCD6808|nr:MULTISPECIES: BrnA antitoxin family protein [unclassified Mesorhizobium]MBZ9737537.1 BrnA antitoxin family protein [Mesorhizobium sp. CO1-1-4]MBZ9802274.1 BrnA antitoxin family protein [Mesorhizobium sp. ES1-6]